MSRDTFRDRGLSEQKLALLASLLEKEGVPQAPRLPSWSALTPIRARADRTATLLHAWSRRNGDDVPRPCAAFGRRPAILWSAVAGPGRELPSAGQDRGNGGVVREGDQESPAHGPYFIAGYCMGGTVAFEVAQQLHGLGEPIALLAMFDTMNWHKIPLTFWSLYSHATQRLFFHAASFLALESRTRTSFSRKSLRS
jgi:hypothetical protein